MGWVKGQSGNSKGRPKTAFREDFDSLKAKKDMYEKGLQVVNEGWVEIVEAMVYHAIAGNHNAAIFIRDTFLGRPKENIQHDLADDAKEGLKLAYKMEKKNEQ